MQNGTSAGINAALMKKVVAKLSEDDVIALGVSRVAAASVRKRGRKQEHGADFKCKVETKK